MNVSLQSALGGASQAKVPGGSVGRADVGEAAEENGEPDLAAVTEGSLELLNILGNCYGGVTIVTMEAVGWGRG